jgi:hypothetical protein
VTTDIHRELTDLYGEDAPLLRIDDHGGSFIGIVQRFNQCFALYDRDKYIRHLCEVSGQGLDAWDEWEEYFDFNVVGAWVGEGTPAFLIAPADVAGRRHD